MNLHSPYSPPPLHCTIDRYHIPHTDTIRTYIHASSGGEWQRAVFIRTHRLGRGAGRARDHRGDAAGSRASGSSIHPASQPLLFLFVIFTGLGAGGACPQERKKAHPHPSPHRLPAAAAFPGPYPTLAGKSLVPGGLRQPSIHPFVRSFHHSIDYGWCDMYRWKPSIVSGWLVSRRISISKVMDSFTTLPSSFLPLLSFLFHTYIHTYIHVTL
mmetsp:Transcript_22826/g.32772  ORF Transcript_22826/g.32772 Transcript_22826/m.32772 type:complete len:213 (+) Transcript_22826:238-876(+)